MRESNRDLILDAVVRILERDGVKAVTFDAVAAETGLTRGGLIYHFPSRDDLMLETHKHVAAQWLAELRRFAADDAPAQARHAAYAQVNVRDATRAELLLMLESASDERLTELWGSIVDHWAPPYPAEGDDVAMTRFLARLAADGLWAHAAVAGRSLPPDVKRRVGQAIVQMIQTTGSDEDA